MGLSSIGGRAGKIIGVFHPVGHVMGIMRNKVGKNTLFCL